MASVVWNLNARGRRRRRASLVDERGRTMAVVRRSRWRRSPCGSAIGPDGRAWTVVRYGEALVIACDGEPRATVEGGTLTVDDRSFVWRLSDDGTRAARVTGSDQDLRAPLVVRASPDYGRTPWAVVTFDDRLPEAFGVLLAACVRLLEHGGNGADVVRPWRPGSTGWGGGDMGIGYGAGYAGGHGGFDGGGGDGGGGGGDGGGGGC